MFTTVEAIKHEIEGLSLIEFEEVAEWIESLRERSFDRGIERDFGPGGRGQTLLADLNREIDEGKTHPIEQAFAEYRRDELAPHVSIPNPRTLLGSGS